MPGTGRCSHNGVRLEQRDQPVLLDQLAQPVLLVRRAPRVLTVILDRPGPWVPLGHRAPKATPA